MHNILRCYCLVLYLIMYEYDWNILLVIENWTKNWFLIHNGMGKVTGSIFYKSYFRKTLDIYSYIFCDWFQHFVGNKHFGILNSVHECVLLLSNLRGIYKHHHGVVLRRKLLKGNSKTFTIAIEHNNASSYEI